MTDRSGGIVTATEDVQGRAVTNGCGKRRSCPKRDIQPAVGLVVSAVHFMLRRPSILGATLLASAAIVVHGCERVALLAPSGSTIRLTAVRDILPIAGSTEIAAFVLEDAGTPPHSGTQVMFATTTGSVEPQQAETDSSGRAVATFHAGSSSGTAIISANSGGATTGQDGVLTILIGGAAVGRVVLTANPAFVSANGGLSTLTARVLDVDGNPMEGIPVTFLASTGILSAGFATTSPAGIAATTLYTTQESTVTAIVDAGAAAGVDGTASVVVATLASPTLTITLPTVPPSVGLPSAYTFTVTSTVQGSASVSDVVDDSLD